jgi:hypothetical protein
MSLWKVSKEVGVTPPDRTTLIEVLGALGTDTFTASERIDIVPDAIPMFFAFLIEHLSSYAE